MGKVNIECRTGVCKDTMISVEGKPVEWVSKATLRFEANSLVHGDFEIEGILVAAEVITNAVNLKDMDEVQKKLAAFGYKLVPLDERTAL